MPSKQRIIILYYVCHANLHQTCFTCTSFFLGLYSLLVRIPFEWSHHLYNISTLIISTLNPCLAIQKWCKFLNAIIKSSLPLSRCQNIPWHDSQLPSWAQLASSGIPSGDYGQLSLSLFYVFVQESATRERAYECRVSAEVTRFMLYLSFLTHWIFPWMFSLSCPLNSHLLPERTLKNICRHQNPWTPK